MAVTTADTPGPVRARLVCVLPTGRIHRRQRTGSWPATGQFHTFDSRVPA